MFISYIVLLILSICYICKSIRLRILNRPSDWDFIKIDTNYVNIYSGLKNIKNTVFFYNDGINHAVIKYIENVDSLTKEIKSHDFAYNILHDSPNISRCISQRYSANIIQSDIFNTVDKNKCIIYEYVGDLTMAEWYKLHIKNQQNIDVKRSVVYLNTRLALIKQKLHSNAFYHCDLHRSNIRVETDPTNNKKITNVFIIDFGLAKPIHNIYKNPKCFISDSKFHIF